MPRPTRYAKLRLPNGEKKIVGSTEASRGCKHLCRHCPIVPVYNGHFRIIPRDIVLEDIRQQVVAGVEHITFGDPDFLNGPRHALEIAQALHQEFPRLTYDATIKIEHLLKHSSCLAALRDTGCLFVTSAAESVDDAVLARLDKGHTVADFVANTNAMGTAPDLSGGNHDLVRNNPTSGGLSAAAVVSTADPLLANLASNGGPSQTLALLPGSPAIDAGNDAVLSSTNPLLTDQRGLARTRARHPRLAAFESRASRNGKEARETR